MWLMIEGDLGRMNVLLNCSMPITSWSSTTNPVVLATNVFRCRTSLKFCCMQSLMKLRWLERWSVSFRNRFFLVMRPLI